MENYRVHLTVTHSVVIIVKASDKEKAADLAEDHWENGHVQDTEASAQRVWIAEPDEEPDIEE